MNLNKNLKIILLNFLGATLMIVALVFITLRVIDSYTLHNEVIEVPSFKGMLPSQASIHANQLQLQIKVTDSLYVAEAEPGSIIDQYPASGAKVKRDRIISLTVNTIEEEKIAMPSLKNVALRQSMNKLTSLGFRIGKITYTPSEYENLVLGYIHHGDTLEAGDMLSKGSVINLILGTGVAQGRVAVPDVRGYSLKSAYQTLLNNHLNSIYVDKNGVPLVGPEYDNTHFVFMQTPKSDTLLDAGSTIFLYSTDNKEELDQLIKELDSLQTAEEPIQALIEFNEENDPGLSEVSGQDLYDYNEE